MRVAGNSQKLSVLLQSQKSLSTAACLNGAGGNDYTRVHNLYGLLPSKYYVEGLPEQPAAKEIAGPADYFEQEDVAPVSLMDTYRGIAGNSAPTVLGGSFLAYLISKEYLIYNSEAYFAILFAGVVTGLVKKIGPSAREYFDNERAKELSAAEAERDEMRATIAEELAQLDQNAELLTTADELYDVYKSTRAMETEASYRKNLLEVETEVKKRLDYQIDLQNLKVQIEQDHMAKWVQDAVVQSITPEQEQQTILKCIDDIELLAAAHVSA